VTLTCVKKVQPSVWCALAFIRANSTRGGWGRAQGGPSIIPQYLMERRVRLARGRMKFADSQGREGGRGRRAAEVEREAGWSLNEGLVVGRSAGLQVVMWPKNGTKDVAMTPSSDRMASPLKSFLRH
jgi:hypothetical protein